MSPITDSINPPLTTIGLGTVLTDGSEQTVLQYLGDMPARFWGVLDLLNMQAADTLRVKEYIYSNSTWGLHSDSVGTITGVAALPKMQIGPTTCPGYRLTIQRTAGADRNYPWELYRGVK
jgi:hypothetical protein